MRNFESAFKPTRYRVAGRRVLASSAACVLLALASCRPADKPLSAPPAPDLVSSESLAKLFAAVSATGSSVTDVDAALAAVRHAAPTDPNWPVATYLAGEVHRQRKDTESARVIFRDLAMWSVSEKGAGPYKDGKGGSGLAVIGLWRWLQILDQHGGTAQEVEQALGTAAALQRTRLFEGMVSSGLLPALPLVEEDVARRLAHVAAAAKRPEAMDLFLDFMSLDSTGELDETDQRLREKLLDEQLATPERLDLYQLRRQVSRVRLEERKRQSAQKLRQLWENQFAPTEVRAEAGYEWSNYNRASDEKKKDVVAALTSAYELAAGRGLIAERSLYLRGMVHNRGQSREPAAFFADMERLLDRFPNGHMADDALYQLATEYLFGDRRDMDRALSYFSRLRDHKFSNDYLDSAYVLAAIGMVDRGTDADLREADKLLGAYAEQFPDGPFRFRGIFWRGRIAERLGDTEAARRHFLQLVTEAPFDYYGLRARMHLDFGTQAISMALPATDSKTANALRAAYQKSVPEAKLEPATPYQERLRVADESGMYLQSRSIVDGLGNRFRNRLDNIALAALDKEQLVPAAALLLALRQDAVAARDTNPTPDNQLRLAAFLGRKLGDWPVALSMIDSRGAVPHGRIAMMQNDPRFLATVYPDGETLQFLKNPLAESAWLIDGSTALSQSLMYSVVRRESVYYPGAISLAGAIGLFQIMPATFEGREDCWKAGLPGQRPTPANYLFDPARNTQFWSCWVGKEFQPTTRESVPMMLVKHHAGRGNLAAWQRTWKGRAIENDLELQIESLRFPATRLFVQRVMTDVTIVDASGLFEGTRSSAGR